MDPNDADIEWILELQSLAPLDSKSWLELGYIGRVAISPELMNLFWELGVSLKEAERGGQWVIPAGEWVSAYHGVTEQLYQRTRLRSLELAVEGPKPEMLATAPRLEKWITVRERGDLASALVGHVSGHPVLSNRWIRTSALCGLAPDQRWARTNSRWYVLGRAATPEHLAQILGAKAKGLQGAALPIHEAISRTERAQAREGFRNDPG
ncbi:DUF6634 family protein [Tateyamaria sp. ANG-S1]|uniref:DUF6634 family protein n=1 Tax=Tateyamaria sp. ANG-S1 TaxID=1577905 RepID=UPI00057FF992|nr:DUF6634 family protein [Tateyamaria sp. ANG-S1]KIC44867.1 hypothetical protein RA29_21555 [Tateyamaria sp. ANG-S1]